MAGRHPVRDYCALARAIAHRHFPTLVELVPEDIAQECALLAWEAESRGRIQVGSGKKRKLFGSGSRGERIGLRAFSRAAYARLYQVARQYGYRRIRKG